MDKIWPETIEEAPIDRLSVLRMVSWAMAKAEHETLRGLIREQLTRIGLQGELFDKQLEAISNQMADQLKEFILKGSTQATSQESHEHQLPTGNLM